MEMNQDDSLRFSPYALEKLIGLVAHTTPGVLGLRGSLIQDLTDRVTVNAFDPTRGVLTETYDNDIEVFIQVALEYGIDGPRVLHHLRDQLEKALAEQAGYHLLAMHVTVVDVMTPEEFAQGKEKVFISYQALS